MARPQSKNVEGLTDANFDGVGTDDLRAWLDYWCNEERSRAAAARKGIDRRDEIVNARVDAGRARKPARDC
jgi:hypothetical protein